MSKTTSDIVDSFLEVLYDVEDFFIHDVFILSFFSYANLLHTPKSPLKRGLTYYSLPS